MPYLPLTNFKYDSGPRRIQSGPDHEGYVVLYSGVEATGPDDGIIVAGTPIEGNAAEGPWKYNSDWRYVPSTLPNQSGALDPTPYNVSGALDTYDATRIYTRDNVAGAQAASAIGPETGKVNPRGGQPERYMYFGGAAPDNQDYSPYNTPDANSAAEGKTGGGVTHRSYESSLLTNVLGSQGTSDRSQWRYHQPVYCKTYTETRRSETPGLMSTPLRYVYRGSASSYNYNYGGELLANKGGFEPIYLEDVPSPPLFVDVTLEPNGCYVITFSPPGNPGSCDVQFYEYSIDNGFTWTALPSFSSPVEICDLGERPFELSVRAVNCVGPGIPSPPKSNCVWEGAGISGSIFAGDTLYAPVICPSGTYTWYVYDDLTNTSTVVGSGQSLKLLNSFIGNRVYTIQSCPDNIGDCSAVYVSGVGPVTGFDPYNYNFARLSGTQYTLRDPGGLSYISLWKPTASLGTTYFFQLDPSATPSIVSNPPAAPWRCNLSLTSIGNFTRTGPFGTVNYYGSDSSIVNISSVFFLTSTFTPDGSTFATFSGVFQFSNDSSTVLASWPGV